MHPVNMLIARAAKGPWRVWTCLALILFHFALGVALAQADSTSDASAIPRAALSGGFLAVVPQPADEDSLQLGLLEIEAEKFRLEAERTNLWHRLIPAVHLSASLGWKEILVLDPATLAPSTLPKDAYRLTIGMSLNDILDGSKHSAAELELQKIEAMREHTRAHQERSRFNLRGQLKALGIEKDAALKEQTILEEILRFDGIRFGQGKLGYDAFMQSKLRLVELNRRLELLARQSDDVRLRLSGKGDR